MVAPVEELAQRARVDDRAREQVRARLPALLEHRDRHLAEPLRQLRRTLRAAARGGSRRRARPGPAPTIRTPTSIRSSGSAGRDDELARDRTAVGSRPASCRAAGAADKLGQLQVRFALQFADDTPRFGVSRRSARSGHSWSQRSRPSSASRPCAGFAPEMPTATQNFGGTVLPVWPTWVKHRNPYSVDDRAGHRQLRPARRPSAAAPRRGPTVLRLPPSPRPPPTMTSASSIDGPLALLVGLLDHRRRQSRSPAGATRTSRPPRCRRSPAARRCPSGRARGAARSFQPTST